MSSLEAEPFLHGEETKAPISAKIQPTRRFWESSALQFGGLVAYTFLVSLASIYIFHGGLNEGQAVIRDFGGKYFALKAKLFIPTTESNYSGEPSPDKDAAWKQLLSQQMIQLTSSELRRSGISTIALQESPGFLATTTLWHELHCIWYLREALYQDYYHLNTSAEEAQLRVTHSDHCLHMLQQSVMCSGDVSLLGLSWEQGKDRPTIQPSSLPHECVDWEQLESTVQARVILTNEVLNLKNPLGSS